MNSENVYWMDWNKDGKLELPLAGSSERNENLLTAGEWESELDLNLGNDEGAKVELYDGKYRNNYQTTVYKQNLNIDDSFDNGNGDTFSVKVTGRVQAYKNGNNRYWVLSDDGVRVTVDGTRYVDRWNDHAPTWDTFTVPDLVKDAYYDIEIDYYENGGIAGYTYIKTTPLNTLIWPQGRTN